MFLHATVSLAAATAAHGPNPIYDAHPTLVKHVANGVHYYVAGPDSANVDILHVYGNAFQRGEAQGLLLGTQLLDFIGPQLDGFYFEQFTELIGGCLEPGQPCKLPKWLVAAIRLLAPTIKRDAPKAFELALAWLEELQRPYNNASAAHVYDEMDGIAQGTCASETVRMDGRECDTASLRTKLHRVNVLTDLIRMQCTVLGAWGKATPDGKLVQLRALDFGNGPFANASYLLVHHPSAESDARAADSSAPQPFASVTFPGFVGVVTGLSPSIALSEKVNDLTNGGTPPGSYHGQNTAFVLRDMLQFGTGKASAVSIAQKAERTWGIWLGVGDATEGRLEVIRYDKAAADTFDDSTLPALTGKPELADVAYVDKHPQPSTRDGSLQEAVTSRYGQLNAATVAQNLPRLHKTGDVHIMVVDYATNHLLIAIGSTSANNTFVGPGGRKAYRAPFLRFSCEQLWKEARPEHLLRLT